MPSGNITESCGCGASMTYTGSYPGHVAADFRKAHTPCREAALMGRLEHTEPVAVAGDDPVADPHETGGGQDQPTAPSPVLDAAAKVAQLRREGKTEEAAAYLKSLRPPRGTRTLEGKR